MCKVGSEPTTYDGRDRAENEETRRRKHYIDRRVVVLAPDKKVVV
jgi:hypothetical protein